MNEESRKAIVVGVNKYKQNNQIPTLGGPENDAREIYEQFKSNGNFDISQSHFLVGPDATREKILKAVGDIFNRKDVSCDLVAFYFSGHGLVDESNVGYIAPYDMDPEDPFVNGINMEELRNFISRSKNKASAVMFLDCCYAGIAAQGTRALTSTAPLTNDETRNLYAGQLQKLVEVGESTGTKRRGRGNIVLASSEATQVSRDKNNCAHLGNNEPHTHGAFSFYLIEGLDGKAADPDTGVITIDSLRNHVDCQMGLEERQKPMYYATDASEIDSIKIAISRGKYNEKIKQIIENVDSLLTSTNVSQIANYILIDVEKLANAAKKVSELTTLDPNNRDIHRLRNGVDTAAKSYFQLTINWLAKNRRYARLPIEQLEFGLYTQKIPMLTQNLSFDSLQEMNQNMLDILIYVCSSVAQDIQFKSEQDPQLTIFQANLRAAVNNGIGMPGQ